MNHLGVDVESTDEVSSAQTRLNDTSLETSRQDNVTCAYAVQDKVWVNDPDKAPWEIYTVTSDAQEVHGSGGEVPGLALNGGVGESVCCGTGSTSESACC